MKKLLLLVAMLAIVLVAAAPALTQPAQGFGESRVKSGANTPKTEVKNSGNNANLCPTVQQVSNTGQVANEQGVVQDNSKADDIDFSGSELHIDGASVTATCDQTIEQAAAAGKAAAK